ncbi:hypothetical protein [Novosphingobium sp. SG720]|uniref:hypothetical protein n=1 Tax=Novosphingobium sp. SG720 TaxID=2586998 RepID=UPI001447249A|nr:hypothetical protein [Novosphingobium sp. SG720]NKJ40825.1 putative chitinase [Novosphingobium sp. SG720]
MIDVRKTQAALAQADYAPGPLDGAWGPSTCTALLAHQAQRQPDAMLRALGRAAAAELPRYGIVNSPARLAEWLAQTGNETGGFTRFEENLRYSARRLLEIWPSRFKTLAQALPYAWDASDPDREDVALANKVYYDRMGNRAGTNDGWDTRGGGLIQHTGKAEYDALFVRLGVTAAQIHGGDPVAMVRACCDYWDRVGANAYCDRGDFRGLRKRVNGGLIGVDEVAARRARSLAVLAGAA